MGVSGDDMRSLRTDYGGERAEIALAKNHKCSGFRA
jgi:hypothetical protein